jgi:hypothetical protein
MNFYLVTILYLTTDGQRISIASSGLTATVQAASDVEAYDIMEKRVKAIPNFAKIEWHECWQHHPVGSMVTENTLVLIDERMFSAQDMYQFAYRIVQEGMAAAYAGDKTIYDLDPSLYIHRQQDKMGGQ